MIYLEFVTWPDFIGYIMDAGRKVSHLDVADLSGNGRYQFHIVATEPIVDNHVLAICSELILFEEEPDFEEEAARKQFREKLMRAIDQRRDEIAKRFRRAGVRLRPGIFSLDPPAVLRNRK